MMMTIMYLCQQVPHIVQQIMSSESTLILCGTILSFEMFMTLCVMIHPNFSHPFLSPLQPHLLLQHLHQHHHQLYSQFQFSQ